VAAFEREFAAAVGAPHACAVSSCTTALHLALVAAGVGPGDEVVTVSHSFIATANAVRYCGAVPVFVDVEIDTFNIDPALVDAAMTPRTRALLVVHQLGMPCDLASLVATARRRGVPVIEDAACAIGSEIRWQGEWQRIGRPHGDMACFSFHPRKLLSTGDGGMVVTASADTDARLRLLRQHGMSVPDTVRHASAQVVFEAYSTLGFNYRLTDIQAALGLAQIGRLDGFLARRRAIAARYDAAFASLPGVEIPQSAAHDRARSGLHLYVAKFDWAALGTTRTRLMARLRERGIGSQVHYIPVYRHPYYSERYQFNPAEFPEAERYYGACLSLPLYPGLTDDDVERVIQTLKQVLAE
jgi:dTDP-4-amino-4,6-dideoxygalactose transaminase